MITPLCTAYILSVNAADPAAFQGLFAPDAVVNDGGREFRGLDAIREWSDREVFGAHVTLAPTAVAEREGDAEITTLVDGDFDRTGLPDPVVIVHRIAAEEGKIARLTCRLAGA